MHCKRKAKCIAKNGVFDKIKKLINESRGIEMQKRIIAIIFVLFASIGLVSCNNKNPLEGEWESVKYQIDEEEQEIVYETLEIVFEEEKVMWNENNYIYEVSESGDSVFLNSRTSETEYFFEVDEETLLFDGVVYYRVDSESHKEYCKEIKKQAREGAFGTEKCN